MKKPLFATIFLVIGLVIGGIIGVYYGAMHLGRPTGRFIVLGATAFKGNNAMQLYKKGEYSAAREALLEYVKILEEVSANPDYGNPRISRTDMVLTFTRLSLLEEANGHDDKAKEFMQRALDETKLTHWEELKKEKLRSIVVELDKYNPLEQK